MEEREHIASVLKQASQALKQEDVAVLKEISNQTVHCSSCFQDPGTTAMAVVIYALSKLIERKESLNIKRWSETSKKIQSYLLLAQGAVKDEKEQVFEGYMESIRTTLTSLSINLKPYVQDILQKASVNKANKIYEHGISLGKTAQLLGLSQWDLSTYTSQRDDPYHATIPTKKRAQIALEFFS
jgi:predicted transcriptional regulator